MTRMNEDVARPDRLRDRIEALAPDRQTVFALACAEHLVILEASEREPELRMAVARGYDLFADASGGLERLHALLSGRDDADQDDVAAVTFALGAALGFPDNAWWAGSRALDAAYARVPYPSEAATFRPLHDDTADPAVQKELGWQESVVALLESDQDLSDVVAKLRA